MAIEHCVSMQTKKIMSNETLIFYNSIECGVDMLDQMSRLYTT